MTHDAAGNRIYNPPAPPTYPEPTPEPAPEGWTLNIIGDSPWYDYDDDHGSASVCAGGDALDLHAELRENPLDNDFTTRLPLDTTIAHACEVAEAAIGLLRGEL